MKKSDLKRHLSPYSIYQKRKTTINHTFASALAPADLYDETRVTEAINRLGQNPDEALSCVYCGHPAQTWDHLVGLVKNSSLYGFGHQLGNLVPCCKECNSAKGNKDWHIFLKEKVKDEEKRENIENTLEGYLKDFAVPIDLLKLQDHSDWKAYNEIQSKILELMKLADEIAVRLRKKLI
jgi:5-methylcytosine-specific restriction endonuclease McrA